MTGLPDVLIQVYRSGHVADRDGNMLRHDSAIGIEAAQQLYDLTRRMRPEHTIEIGLAQGTSALAVAQALEDNGAGTHHVVDPFQEEHYGGVGLTSLERSGLMHRIDFHEAFPEEAVPSFPIAGLAFIDGSHLFDFTIVDFVVVDKRLAVGGLIGFDDAGVANVQKALRYITLNRSYRAVFTDGQPRQRIKARVGPWIARLPGVERVLRPEILRPSAALGLLGRVVYLMKDADDSERHWRQGLVGF